MNHLYSKPKTYGERGALLLCCCAIALLLNCTKPPEVSYYQDQDAVTESTTRIMRYNFVETDIKDPEWQAEFNAVSIEHKKGTAYYLLVYAPLRGISFNQMTILINNSLILNTDGKIQTFTVDRLTNKPSNSKIRHYQEGAYYKVNKDILMKIKNASDVKFKLVGRTWSFDGNLNQINKDKIGNFVFNKYVLNEGNPNK